MGINISYEIERLIQFGLNKNLICDEDVDYTRNRIMETLEIDSLEETKTFEEKLDSPETILGNILEWAFEMGHLKEKGVVFSDLLDTKIMGCLMPRPSVVIQEFSSQHEKDKGAATDYFYELSKSSNYIRVGRISKDLKWETETQYGNLQITINLSKPEKSTEEITRERNIKASSYPKCLLCRENEGYAGRINHPARQNHRIIPITLNNEKWFFQYSPYVYYNEHCIILKGKHEPMKLSRESFVRLLDFMEQFPHYFIGSNADLPIVGGSILSHDHFQGGRHEFPMAKAEAETEFRMKGFEEIKASRVKWPVSVIRLEGKDRSRLIEAAFHIYRIWQGYSDEEVQIQSYTNGIHHNTVTPIARMAKENFQFDIVLRNNRTTEEYPEGIFHPHRELQHIKRENIGLIEVMGLAVLPSRLKTELEGIKSFLIDKGKSIRMDEESELLKHREWCSEILQKYSDINSKNVEGILQREVGLRFLRVLEDAGVFKRNPDGIEAFERFINILR